MKNKYIIATRTFTYDVEQIRTELNEMNDSDASDEDIWEMVNEWVYEDMRSPVSRHDMKMTDEDGVEI